ncbi:hypothetical protein JD82_01821 [Prauserella rugosa]|uniref:Integrase-like protein n=1 Tax=Prauserella rugosa TaxID=43354 RepID=A0A660CE38_9PSEU|nr:hypothetical protein JD82_01821 [Prauserella rugosa]
MAYAEILGDEKGPTCAGYLLRAADFFVDHRVTIRQVLSDNAKNYTLSRDFTSAMAAIGAEQSARRKPPISRLSCTYMPVLAEKNHHAIVWCISYTCAVDLWL